jgi:hypothetical protein
MYIENSSGGNDAKHVYTTFKQQLIFNNNIVQYTPRTLERILKKKKVFGLILSRVKWSTSPDWGFFQTNSSFSPAISQEKDPLTHVRRDHWSNHKLD